MKRTFCADEQALKIFNKRLGARVYVGIFVLLLINFLIFGAQVAKRGISNTYFFLLVALVIFVYYCFQIIKSATKTAKTIAYLDFGDTEIQITTIHLKFLGGLVNKKSMEDTFEKGKIGLKEDKLKDRVVLTISQEGRFYCLLDDLYPDWQEIRDLLEYYKL
ncbi:MAG TPA: hypothetical protein VMH27_19110 [Puia sp.]|nr:hypothetical protein [Puia sp.]